MQCDVKESAFLLITLKVYINILNFANNFVKFTVKKHVSRPRIAFSKPNLILKKHLFGV